MRCTDIEIDGESGMDLCLQGKGPIPFLQTNSNVPRELCLLLSYVVCSQPRTPRGNILSLLCMHLPMQWSSAGPYGSQAVWFRLGLGKEVVYSTLPALGQLLVPGECSLIPDSLHSVFLPPSLTSGEKGLEPKSLKLKANILLLFD